jgi:hypothetical protein
MGEAGCSYLKFRRNIVDLLNTLMKAAGSGDLQKLGKQFGLDGADVGKVLAQVVPALGSGMAKNASSAGGLESLMGALQKGNHQDYLGKAEEARSSAVVREGNGILGHIFGSKEVSRKVASQAASESGVDSGIIKKMLPMIAAMAMGALSKESGGGQQKSMLGSLLGGGDGGGLDDILNLAKKFF